MKTSLLLALAICLGVFSVMADALEIPALVLERQQASCSEFHLPIMEGTNFTPRVSEYL